MRPLQNVFNRALATTPAKPVWFLLSLLPAGYLVWAVLAQRLGANPAEALIRASGDWGLRALCLALAITPLREALGLHGLARLRRMAGLFAYFYASLHLLAYAGLDMGLDLQDIGADILKRPFILVGFAAWLVLGVLALTSAQRLVRWLGARRWKRLHRGVYLAVLLALLHFYWMRAAKQRFGDVQFWSALVAVLLGWRLAGWGRRQVQRASLAATEQQGAGSGH